ncbi:MAG: SHOCT domain-containing protein [Epulopiscium sp.]|nr:SHOCT domain-containing protein [Candidatus Epulonipiscium sp.]
MHRYFNNGYHGNGFCPSFGVFHNGGSIIVGLGIVITIALVFYLFAYNNKKKRISSEALESLKLQYVKGQLSEEEYLRRKSLIDL